MFPLHEAVTNDNQHQLKQLLSEREGTSKNDVKNDDGDTALHIAVRLRNKNCVKTLLEHSFDPMTYNKSFETPLRIAAGKNYQPIIKLMLNRFNGKDLWKQGLYAMLFCDDLDTKRELIRYMVEEHGASADADDRAKRRLLQYAIESLDNIEYLEENEMIVSLERENLSIDPQRSSSNKKTFLCIK